MGQEPNPWVSSSFKAPLAVSSAMDRTQESGLDRDLGLMKTRSTQFSLYEVTPIMKTKCSLKIVKCYLQNWAVFQMPCNDHKGDDEEWHNAVYLTLLLVGLGIFDSQVLHYILCQLLLSFIP